MKKLLLFVSFICLGLALSAQSRWAFGLEAEGGYGGRADLYEETFPSPQVGDFYTRSELKPQLGWSAGVWTEFLVNHRLGLRLSANYGNWNLFSELENISYNTGGIMTTYGRNSYYQEQSQLRIPLEGKLYFGPADRRTRFFVKAGIQASYLVSEVNITNYYYGAMGQAEAYKESYAQRVDLSSEWGGIKRWQTAFIGGLGMTIDRAKISLQRVWTLSEKGSYGFGGCCGFGFCDCFAPSPSVGRLTRQIEQTSLKFSYLIF